MCGACPPASGRRGTAEVHVAQGPAQAEPLGEGPLRRGRRGRGRQGGGGRLQPGGLGAAVEGQEVVLQESVVVLQLTLLSQQGGQAQLKFALQDGGQLLEQLVEAVGFGPGSLQVALQALQGGGGAIHEPQRPLAWLGLGRPGFGGKPVSCRHQHVLPGPSGAPT